MAAGTRNKDLPVDEVERVKADARGDRRARRKAQDDAAEHQRTKRRQRQPVDRPPPFAQKAWVARARPSCPQLPSQKEIPAPSGDTGMV